MRRALFGKTGYGLDALGTEQSVKQLKAGGLREFHGQLTVPNNCVLSIFGDVDAKAVKAAVTKAFGKWKTGAAALTVLPKAKPLERIERVNETRDKKQAVLLVGFPEPRCSTRTAMRWNCCGSRAAIWGQVVSANPQKAGAGLLRRARRTFWDSRRDILRSTPGPRRRGRDRWRRNCCGRRRCCETRA